VLKALGIIFIYLVSFSAVASEEIMFEGYYKITASDKPIGYTVQRYTYNSKSQQFTSKYYVYAKSPAGQVTESLTAVADNQFHPVSYKYTAVVGKALSSIDAQFKKQKQKQGWLMTYTAANGQQNQSFQKSISSDVFLSTFQVYLMLQKGLKPETKLNFSAISEEDGEVQPGEALVKIEPGFEGKGIYRVLTKFKGIMSIANVNAKGEVIIAQSPVQKIQQTLVSVPAEATNGFPFDQKAIRYVFGDIPRGKVNQLAINKEKSNASANTAIPSGGGAPGSPAPTSPTANGMSSDGSGQGIKINPPTTGSGSSQGQ